jgi:predicted small lipoprotein YifL
MKKKIGLSLLVFLFLFTLTGCGGKEEKEEKKDNKKEETVVDNTLVKVNEIELHINKDKEFKGIKYTITDDLKEAKYDQYVQYYLYQDDGPNLLFFRIFYYENKAHKDIRKDLAIEDNLTEEKGKTDNIEYTFIDSKRTDGTIHFYIIDKGNISYAINFVSQYDIKDFENKVLNSIKF